MESDEALRLRVPQPLKGFQLRGQLQLMNFMPEHRRSGGGCQCNQPGTCRGGVTVLSREGDGTAEKDLLDVVKKL